MNAGLSLRDLIRQFKQDWPMRNDDPDIDTGEPKNSIITRMLNQAQDDIHSSLCALPNRVAVNATVEYPADTQFVIIPGWLGRIETIQGRPASLTFDANITLMRTNMDMVTRMSGTGSPSHCCMAGNRFFLLPRPSEAWEITVWHAGSPMPLTAPADRPLWLMPKFHPLLVAKAIQTRRRLTGESSQSVDAAVARLEGQMIAEYEALFPDNPVREDPNLEDFYE